MMDTKKLLQVFEDMVHQYVQLNGRVPEEIRANSKMRIYLGMAFTDHKFLGLGVKKYSETAKSEEERYIEAELESIWRKERWEALHRNLRLDKGLEAYKICAYEYDGYQIPFVEDEQENFIRLC